MPAEGIHLTALREALAAPGLGPSARRRIVRDEDGARLGALLVDLPYFDRYAGEVARYLLRRPARPSRWGTLLHDGGAVALLTALLDEARAQATPLVGAIALGLASHLAIDRALHPLINALARAHPHGDHGSSHREVEKFQSICFHEAYLGRDLMGHPGISRHLAIRLTGELARPALARPLVAAFHAAFADAPTVVELARFGRGYRTHAWLLGTPAGRRIAPPAAKEAARPRYLHGAWGAFADHLAAAVTASLPIIDAAADVLDATTGDVAAAHAALARRLPPGTIDPAGDDVALTRRFVVALPTAA
ncbi:MAG: zinc dependent phospholipase C family protein [Kofleriaceae bacterium]